MESEITNLSEPELKSKSKILPILGGLVALVMFVGVAGASYYISNQLSNKLGLAPNAPLSEPEAAGCNSSLKGKPCGTQGGTCIQCPQGSASYICAKSGVCKWKEDPKTKKQSPVVTPLPTDANSIVLCSSLGVSDSCSKNTNPTGASTCSKNGVVNFCCPIGQTISNNKCIGQTSDQTVTITATPTLARLDNPCGTEIHGSVKCLGENKLVTCVNGNWIPGNCTISGQTCPVGGKFCVTPSPTIVPPTITPTIPALQNTQKQVCIKEGGQWINNSCVYPTATPTQKPTLACVKVDCQMGPWSKCYGAECGKTGTKTRLQITSDSCGGAKCSDSKISDSCQMPACTPTPVIPTTKTCTYKTCVGYSCQSKTLTYDPVHAICPTTTCIDSEDCKPKPTVTPVVVTITNTPTATTTLPTSTTPAKICTPNWNRCNRFLFFSSYSQKCNSDGTKWNTVQTCSNGCNDSTGLCIASPAVTTTLPQCGSESDCRDYIIGGSVRCISSTGKIKYCCNQEKIVKNNASCENPTITPPPSIECKGVLNRPLTCSCGFLQWCDSSGDCVKKICVPHTNSTPIPSTTPIVIPTATPTQIVPPTQTPTLTPTSILLPTQTPTEIPTPVVGTLVLPNQLVGPQNIDTFGIVADDFAGVLYTCQQSIPKSGGAEPNYQNLPKKQLQDCFCKKVNCSNTVAKAVANHIMDYSQLNTELQCVQFIELLEYVKPQTNNQAIASACAADTANALAGCTGPQSTNLFFCPKQSVKNTGFVRSDILVWKNSGSGHTAICTQPNPDGSCSIWESNFYGAGMISSRNINNNNPDFKDPNGSSEVSILAGVWRWFPSKADAKKNGCQ
jgi:hypothetical protein